MCPRPTSSDVDGDHPSTSAAHRPEDYIMAVLTNAEKEIAAASKDPLIASDPAKLNTYVESVHERARNTINMIPRIFGAAGATTGTGASPPPAVTYEAYYRAARAKFPQATDEQVLRTYQREVLGR